MTPGPVAPPRPTPPESRCADEFRVAWSVSRAAFDPHAGPEHLSLPFLTPVYDRLVKMRADGSLGPMLAERWIYTAGGRRLTIELRDDARFHDGSPIDAAAVRSSIVRGQSPTAAPAIRRHLGQIGKIELVGPYELEFDVTDRAAGLPAALATAPGMIVDTRNLTGAGPLAAPLGSGPFVLADRGAEDDTSRYRFERAVEHWDSATPRAAAFSIGEITGHHDRLDALLRGDVDIIDVRAGACADATQHASAGRIRLASYPSTTTVTLQIDRRSDVLHDIRLRRAIALAIDRPSLVALYGEQAEAAGQCLPPVSPAHDATIDATRPQDLAAARRLVSRAGTRRSLRLMQFEAVEPAATVLTHVADDLRAVGFHVEITTLPPAELVAAWQEGGFDLRLTHATALPGDAFELERRLNPAQQPGDLGALSPSLPPLVDQLHDQRMSAAAAEELHRELNRRMAEDCVFVELCRLRCDVAAAPHIVGIDRLPFASFNLFDGTDITLAPSAT